MVARSADGVDRMAAVRRQYRAVMPRISAGLVTQTLGFGAGSEFHTAERKNGALVVSRLSQSGDCLAGFDMSCEVQLAMPLLKAIRCYADATGGAAIMTWRVSILLNGRQIEPKWS